MPLMGRGGRGGGRGGGGELLWVEDSNGVLEFCAVRGACTGCTTSFSSWYNGSLGFCTRIKEILFQLIYLLVYHKFR